jgi:hypothetical protein
LGAGGTVYPSATLSNNRTRGESFGQHEILVKALSVRQPWAWAIIHAGKDIENRSWNTHRRGTIAVHASGNLDREAKLPEGSKKPKPEELVRGAIVGLVDIVDVVTEHPSEWFSGPYGFVLKNPRSLPRPIPCKGSLGFWKVPPDVLEEMEFQLTEKLDDSSP